MDKIKKTLTDLEANDLYRRLMCVDSAQGASVKVSGKEYLLLSSNNYLGLAANDRVVNAAKESLDKYGFGSGASRLVSGTMSPHAALEQVIADYKGTEAAILFNSGYGANIGLISALTDKNDIIFSDKLNHASIVDAAIMSHATVKRYPHKDMAALERFLKEAAGYANRIIVTDGVFSMDGDIAPLHDIVALAKKYDATVIVDDAHATGVLGESGKGTLAHLGINSGNIIQMGTLSKALGCFGAFVACKRDFVEYLINKSRSFIYTTALPPSTASAAIEAIRIARADDTLRERLFENVAYLRDKMINAGFNILNSETHIIPLIVGDAKEAVDMSRYLFERGIFIQAIRPPTVPKGMSRLRITPTALHTKEQLGYVFDRLKEFREEQDG